MGEIRVRAALEDFFDRFLGRGDAAITVPVFDGSLKPNQLLEHAEIVGEFAEPEDLAVADGALYLADGSTLRRIDGNSSREVRRFERPVTALASLSGGRLAAALGGAEIRVFAAVEGTDAGKVITGGGMGAINALAAGPDGTLLATDGSASEPYQEWARDLLNRGRSGRLLSIDIRLQRDQGEGVRAALCLRRGCSRDGRAGQRKLAAPPGDGRGERRGAPGV